MGTKNEPGEFDCYAKAEGDEPMFTLLARDPLAEDLVWLWADWAESEGSATIEKIAEARRCANVMRAWRMRNQ